MKINQHETSQYGKVKTIYREKRLIELDKYGDATKLNNDSLPY